MNNKVQNTGTAEAGVKGSPQEEARMREAMKLAKETEKSEVAAGIEFKGRVAEVVGEFPPEEAPTPAQAAQQQARAMTAQERLEHLQKHLPPRNKMEKEVRAEIKKQIRSLEKEAKKVLYKRNFHLLNNIYLKICELTGILAQLAQETFEYLKSLWLRFVHGIVL